MIIKHKISVIFLMVVLFTMGKSYAQEVLTPREAVKIALKNNYSIQIAKNEQKITENNYAAGKTAFLPTLDANGNYTKSSTNTKLKFFDGRSINQNNAKSTNMSAGATLNWTIFDGLKMFAAFGRLKEMRKNGELNFKSTVENNITDVLSTYYNIVAQQQVLEVISKNIALSQERVRIAQSKLEYGSGSKFDLLQAQVDLNSDKASLMKGQNDLSSLKIKLDELLGRESGTEFVVQDTIEIDTLLSMDNLKPKVEKENSQLQLAKQNENISKIDLKLAQSDLFPKISLNLGYDFNKSESQAGFVESSQNTGLNYGITASFNIFNGLDTRRQIENAQVNIYTSKTQFKQVNNQVHSNLLNTFRRYKNSLELISLDTENLKVAEENVSIALEKIKLGNITPLEFRETQTKMLSAKSNLVSAQYDAKVAEIELLKLSGQLVKSD